MEIAAGAAQRIAALRPGTAMPTARLDLASRRRGDPASPFSAIMLVALPRETIYALLAAGIRAQPAALRAAR